MVAPGVVVVRARETGAVKMPRWMEKETSATGPRELMGPLIQPGVARFPA